MTPRRIDAHLHLWDRALGVHDWITPDLGGVNDDFPASRAAPLVEAAGVTSVVLVQAADHARDTRYLLKAAAANEWVGGVVGWVDLERPERLEEELAAYDGNEYLCGVRQLIHDDARRDVLDLPEVRRTARLLADCGLPLDVPDAYPDQLCGAISLAAAVDGLTLVLDHLGKPPRGREELDDWAAQVRALARHPGVVAKVSGLQTPDMPFDAASLRGVWDVALEAFGPERLMFGSDWPMTVDGPGYAGVVGTTAELVGELTGAEQDWVWWRTAATTYGLDVTTKGCRAC
jgi:L-fuconolactonase